MVTLNRTNFPKKEKVQDEANKGDLRKEISYSHIVPDNVVV